MVDVFSVVKAVEVFSETFVRCVTMLVWWNTLIDLADEQRTNGR